MVITNIRCFYFQILLRRSSLDLSPFRLHPHEDVQKLQTILFGSLQLQGIHFRNVRHQQAESWFFGKIVVIFNVCRNKSISPGFHSGFFQVYTSTSANSYFFYPVGAYPNNVLKAHRAHGKPGVKIHPLQFPGRDNTQSHPSQSCWLVWSFLFHGSFLF
jgi:hypothetical protein